MIRRLLLLAILTTLGYAGYSQTSLEGKLTDAESGESIAFANVILYKNGTLIQGQQTDFDGNYVFSSIDPGTYDVEASFTGYPAQRQVGVVVLAGKAIKLDFALTTGINLDVIEVIEYKVPLIEQDNTTQGGIKTAEQIRNLPVKNINAIAGTTAGLSSIDGGGINVRGSRSNATNYYLDGIRVTGANIPQSEIEQLQVITGGIEARYGDVTGGLISLTSKGPSQRMSGMVEVETSEFTDPYGYNLLSANLSGPLLKNKTTDQSIIGFRASAQYRQREDPNPRAFGGYYAKADVIDQIAADPLFSFNGTPVPYAELLEAEDVELSKARKNVADQRIDLTGKLDFRFNEAIDFTLSGNYYKADGHFQPNRAWSLLNWQHNPYFNDFGYVVNGRFRHRIGSSVDASDPDARPGLIRNISYTIQAGWEKTFSDQGDDRYRENLFEYGYIGNFDVQWTPFVGISEEQVDGPYKTWDETTQLWYEHFGYTEITGDGGFTPSPTINQLLSNYNLEQDVNHFRDYNVINGFQTNTVNNLYASLWNNTGSVYNQFAKGETDIITGALNAGFDLFPGGSDKGRHNIQFGLLYEQRHNRNWSINPMDLWTNMRLAANDRHILGLDSTRIVGTEDFELLFNGQTFIIPVNVYDTYVQENPALLFYRSVRQLTGQGLNEYVNIDGLTPDQLNLGMFASEELTSRRTIDYYGYDIQGNKSPFSTTFDDFFTTVDAEGRRTLPVAGNKPIYTAAYIQDKFTFNDIIFRLGLRVDRYDANTKVLKDPYSLYEIMGAGDFFSTSGTSDPRPDAVEDHWKVYVNSSESTTVRAYRDGNQWYTADGTPANDGSQVLGNEIPNPYYVERNPANRNIRNRDFNPANSFQDYVPQVNWMPRLAFSFPISDEANFFVHYDVLAQRPPSNTIATALDYFYWADNTPNNAPRNNPDLRPEKTIDFEVGFKQKVSNSSALTLSAYYKEMRDMIQRINYLYVPGVPGNSYQGYGNLDFGTVKGFSFMYDLRRTRNLELTASYTLQFADGTGSDANSQANLNQRGNIRYLSPLSFDERHRLAANIDYRYGQGSQYNGPKIFGLDFFSNAGASIQLNAASGRPYTKNQRAERYGSSGIGGAINGARLPWNFTMDMRIDKSFYIGGEEAARRSLLNIYLRMENVFNAKNIIGVYAASGSAYDDGYLLTPLGQSSIQTLQDTGRGDDVDNYLLSYSWGLLNSGFFTLPRRVYLGAVFEF